MYSGFTDNNVLTKKLCYLQNFNSICTLSIKKLEKKKENGRYSLIVVHLTDDKPKIARLKVIYVYGMLVCVNVFPSNIFTNMSFPFAYKVEAHIVSTTLAP